MQDNIITSETPSTSTPFNPSTRVICHVCQKQFSQYTCPRCNSRYCSLPCYKSHSLSCTESFMRENVVQELQLLQPDDQTKLKVLNILKRLHAEEEMNGSEEEDSILSEETIVKILAGNQVSFNDLSAEEKKRFHCAIASGELSKLIKPWNPWWSRLSAGMLTLGEGGTKLIQPILEDKPAPDQIEADELYDIPAGPDTPLPPVSCLSSTEPSPLLAIHLVDIAYSYCFTLRLYNGDWQSDVVGAAMVVLNISSVLGQCGQPETLSEALSHCLEQTCCPSFRHVGGLQFGLVLLDDVIKLLDLGGSALVCLLCDLQRLLQSAQRELKLEKAWKSKTAEMKSKLKSAYRKIHFIMCWVHEQPEKAWHSLATMVKADKVSVMECIGSQNHLRKDDLRDARGRPLIKEIQ